LTPPRIAAIALSAPSRSARPLLLVAAGIVGVVVGSAREPQLLIAVVVYLSVWLAVGIARRMRRYALASTVLLGLVLPDVLANAGMGQVWVVLLIANAAVLLAAGVHGPLQRQDVGLLALSAAVLWPYAVGGGLETARGALGLTVAIYAIGRSRGVGVPALVELLLLVGAVHGLIAIAQSVPVLASLVPFTPVRDGASFVSGRAVGLFNNPNTLGTLEAVILVTAMCLAPRRSTAPLLVLCAAGLILSSSREAILGLLIGSSVLGVGRLRRVVWPAVVIIVAGVIVAAAFPAVLERLDPSGYASDPNLLGRIDAWQAALAVIDRSPVFGYGSTLPQVLLLVDNAYLVWLLTGGVVGLVLWMIGAVVITPRELWPLLAAMLVISTLANPFAGPTQTVFLLACGAMAAENAARSRAARDVAAARKDSPQPTIDELTPAGRAVHGNRPTGAWP
jgi:hypothetical protein